jgi:hypothetical protein
MVDVLSHLSHKPMGLKEHGIKHLKAQSKTNPSSLTLFCQVIYHRDDKSGEHNTLQFLGKIKLHFSIYIILLSMRGYVSHNSRPWYRSANISSFSSGIRVLYYVQGLQACVSFMEGRGNRFGWDLSVTSLQ